MSKKPEGVVTTYTNLSKAHLVEHAIIRGEGILSETGALVVNTKKYTGRSPDDKFTVHDDLTKDRVWFNTANKPMKPVHAQNLYEKVAKYLAERSRYVLHCEAGASIKHRLKLRITTERAWHSLFAHNMFAVPDDIDTTAPHDFEVLHAPGFLAQKESDHTNSEAAIVVDYTKRRIVICGTEYAGEIKKSVFGVLNFLLPLKGVLGMHCAANKNARGESAIFFGLSGTGKTTLSSEKSRALIGDDEHGWDDEGIFNFEAGCYAKVINLSKVDEPEIFSASQRFSATLENVVCDEKTRVLDLFNAQYTENTRASYDLSFIENACLTRTGPHPKHIIMLTCDAFGVLPPIAKLDADFATYHFINGYTAKVAGTERGVKEPHAVFSACFGAPFMSHRPEVYANILREKIKRHHVQCWLINTGWTGGPYGVGSRIKITQTRALLAAALSGQLDQTEFVQDLIFRLDVPKQVPNFPEKILFPQDCWADKAAYLAQAKILAKLFHENFQPYLAILPKELSKAAPVI